ncbi:hypothetical protein GCK32_010614 [Trichostrongylus colubriformis]|uniref:Transthyretin-like family protein n=1 Tax=Trichostrongylus colubriformis TaxID=6319 RepID=A0AAN8FE38_TRICO
MDACKNFLLLIIYLTISLSRKEVPQHHAIAVSGMVCCGKAVDGAVVVLWQNDSARKYAYSRVRTNKFGQFLLKGYEKDRPITPVLRVIHKCQEDCEFEINLSKVKFTYDTTEEVHDLGVIQLDRLHGTSNATC